MKRLFLRAEALPFWILCGAIGALLLLEHHPTDTWTRIRQYLLSPPFFYQSLTLYLLALVLGLLTYRSLYNVKVLLAVFLFLVTGTFAMLSFIGIQAPNGQFIRIQSSEGIRMVVYLLYGLDLLLIALVPSYLPKAFTRIFLGGVILCQIILLAACPRVLCAALETRYPWMFQYQRLVVIGLNGLVGVLAHVLSARRRDPYAWSITAFLVLFSVAFLAGGAERREVLLLHLVPLALALMVLANLTTSLSHHAHYDSLLNIYNRGYCNDILQGKARSLGRRFAMALFDLDHFKKVNDRYGHAVGDMVLYQVAQKIRQKALPRGITCRYGGEEILVLFPDTSLEYAERVSREVVSSIAQLRVPVRGKRRKATLRITVSGGVAAGGSGGDGALAVLEAADRGLYRAKRLGRNRLVVVRTRSSR